MRSVFEVLENQGLDPRVPKIGAELFYVGKKSITGLLLVANPNDHVKCDTGLSFFYVWVNPIAAEVARIYQRYGIESRGQVTDEEFLEETMTLHRLGVYGVLGRLLKTANCLEGRACARRRTLRESRPLENSSQRQRWLATALAGIEPPLRKNFK